MSFIAQLAVRLYRIANFAPGEEAPLTEMDRPGLTEVEKVLRESLNLWQIVVVDDQMGDHSDLDNSEIVELKGSRNEIYSGTLKAAIAHAKIELVKSTEEHYQEFFDEEAPIEYKTEVGEGGFTVLTSKIDGEVFAEVTLYPVEITHG